MSEHNLINELQHTHRIAAHLIANGVQVREIRVHGRARPAIVLNRPPQLPVAVASKAYAWGIDHCGKPYERHACAIDGVQIQWEIQRPATACSAAIVPFPMPTTQPTRAGFRNAH